MAKISKKPPTQGTRENAILNESEFFFGSIDVETPSLRVVCGIATSLLPEAAAGPHVYATQKPGVIVIVFGWFPE